MKIKQQPQTPLSPPPTIHRYSKTQTLRDNSKTKTKIKDNIATVLEGRWTKKINFCTTFLTTTPEMRLHSFTLNQESFAKIAHAIRSDVISIIQWNKDDGRYESTSSTLSLPPPPPRFHLASTLDPESINFRSLLIHEATHAACDLAAIGDVPSLTTEAIAYLAQAIALEADLSSLPSGSFTISESISNEALSTIKRFNLTRKSITYSPAHIHDLNLTTLKDKIRKDPRYQGQENTISRFDGL